MEFITAVVVHDCNICPVIELLFYVMNTYTHSHRNSYDVPDHSAFTPNYHSLPGECVSHINYIVTSSLRFRAGGILFPS